MGQESDGEWPGKISRGQVRRGSVRYAGKLVLCHVVIGNQWMFFSRVDQIHI